MDVTLMEALQKSKFFWKLSSLLTIVPKDAIILFNM